MPLLANVLMMMMLLEMFLMILLVVMMFVRRMILMMCLLLMLSWLLMNRFLLSLNILKVLSLGCCVKCDIWVVDLGRVDMVLLFQ
jgi:hypothetical protein